MAHVPSIYVYQIDDVFIVRFEPPGVVVKNVGIFMNNEALAIKDRHKVSVDVKEDECQNCEVCCSNISRLNSFVKVIQADTERLLWISAYLRTLALDSRSETFRD